MTTQTTQTVSTDAIRSEIIEALEAGASGQDKHALVVLGKLCKLAGDPDGGRTWFARHNAWATGRTDKGPAEWCGEVLSALRAG